MANFNLTRNFFCRKQTFQYLFWFRLVFWSNFSGLRIIFCCGIQLEYLY